MILKGYIIYIFLLHFFFKSFISLPYVSLFWKVNNTTREVNGLLLKNFKFSILKLFSSKKSYFILVPKIQNCAYGDFFLCLNNHRLPIKLIGHKASFTVFSVTIPNRLLSSHNFEPVTQIRPYKRMESNFIIEYFGSKSQKEKTRQVKGSIIFIQNSNGNQYLKVTVNNFIKANKIVQLKEKNNHIVGIGSMSSTRGKTVKIIPYRQLINDLIKFDQKTKRKMENGPGLEMIIGNYHNSLYAINTYNLSLVNKKRIIFDTIKKINNLEVFSMDDIKKNLRMIQAKSVKVSLWNGHEMHEHIINVIENTIRNSEYYNNLPSFQITNTTENNNKFYAYDGLLKSIVKCSEKKIKLIYFSKTSILKKLLINTFLNKDELVQKVIDNNVKIYIKKINDIEIHSWKEYQENLQDLILNEKPIKINFEIALSLKNKVKKYVSYTVDIKNFKKEIVPSKKKSMQMQIK